MCVTFSARMGLMHVTVMIVNPSTFVLTATLERLSPHQLFIHSLVAFAKRFKVDFMCLVIFGNHTFVLC